LFDRACIDFFFHYPVVTCRFLGWGVSREEGTRVVDELRELHDIGVDPRKEGGGDGGRKGGG
jgi:hypothetical protein